MGSLVQELELFSNILNIEPRSIQLPSLADLSINSRIKDEALSFIGGANVVMKDDAMLLEYKQEGVCIVLGQVIAVSITHQ